MDWHHQREIQESGESNHKKAEVTILTSEKIDFKTRTITRDKGDIL